LSGAAPAMRPWPGLAPYGRSVRTRDGGELFFFDSGASGPAADRPAIVLIHGLGDEADSWRRLFPLLAAEARVLAPDLPGFGRSAAGRRVNLASCAASILELLDAEGIGRAILAGSSLGAVIAQLAALRDAARAPGRVAALALVDGGLPGLEAAPGAWRSTMPILGERGYAGLRGRPEAAYRSLGPYYADLASLPEEDRAFLRARVEERVESATQMRAYFSLIRSLALWAACRQGLFRRALAAFGGPVLVAWGAEDGVVAPRCAGALTSIAQRATKVLIPGSGHLPQQERPEELARALLGLAAPLAGAAPSGEHSPA
jgi:pimeloyl-ACP methyl ester carboxylesterase